jgi:hypothetical protein
MTRFVKAAFFASLFFALTFSSNTFAQKGGGTGGGGNTGGGGGNGGGGNGGGGTATPPPPASNAPLTFTGGPTDLTIKSDQPVFVLLRATSDGRDAPVITENFGPAGLILQNTLPADHPHGTNGFTVTTYEWTPSRADIGTGAQASFTATTQSGAKQTIMVNMGPVEDVASGAISGLTAQAAGDHIEARWNPSADGTPLVYTVTACYHSLLTGTTLPYLFCDTVGKTSGLDLLNIPLGPSQNAGQPGVPATYYGIFAFAASAADSHLEGQASANVQTVQ